MPAFTRLEVIEAGAARSVVELGPRGNYVLGRHDSSDVVLRYEGVSRRHALLCCDGERRSIQDLGSRNGTHLNGMEVKAESALAHGDTIRLGATTLLRVVLAEEPFAQETRRIDPPTSVRRFALSRVVAEDAPAPPRRICEACDKELDAGALGPRSGAHRLDDGSIVCPACAHTLTTRDRIGGRYRMLAKLGEGGVAVVVKAIDEDVRRLVAVKLLKPNLPSLVLAYLDREVAILRALDHPGILRLLETGEHDGARFLVTELVRGSDLASIIDVRGRVAAAQTALVGFHVAGALALAHRRGVVHRDVKPSNVLVDRAGSLKLADFGVARWAAEPRRRGPSERLTVRGARRGTPAYMAPEQARDPASAGPAADVYGLGASLYHMLSGEPPYGNGSAYEILERIDRGEPPADLLASVSATNVGLAAAVRRSMARSPGDRYPDALAFRDALLDCVDGTGDLGALLRDPGPAALPS